MPELTPKHTAPKKQNYYIEFVDARPMSPSTTFLYLQMWKKFALGLVIFTGIVGFGGYAILSLYVPPIPAVILTTIALALVLIPHQFALDWQYPEFK